MNPPNNYISGRRDGGTTSLGIWDHFFLPTETPARLTDRCLPSRNGSPGPSSSIRILIQPNKWSEKESEVTTTEHSSWQTVDQRGMVCCTIQFTYLISTFIINNWRHIVKSFEKKFSEPV